MKSSAPICSFYKMNNGSDAYNRSAEIAEDHLLFCLDRWKKIHWRKLNSELPPQVLTPTRLFLYSVLLAKT